LINITTIVVTKAKLAVVPVVGNQEVVNGVTGLAMFVVAENK
jgi:hypothetical protein